jgi:acyl-CoA thioester hydrolase
MGQFRHRLRVRYNECDPQGIVFNANFLTYFDIAITELYREAFGSWEQAMSEHCLDAVVAEARVRYLAPLHFDEQFELVAQIDRLGDTSTTTAISVERDGTRVAEGEVRHVFVDPESRAKTAIPEQVRKTLLAYCLDPV